MKVVREPVFGWAGPTFVCANCQAHVVFDRTDLRDKAFRARETLLGGWQVRARCLVCASPLAQFRQEVPDADQS